MYLLAALITSTVIDKLCFAPFALLVPPEFSVPYKEVFSSPPPSPVCWYVGFLGLSLLIYVNKEFGADLLPHKVSSDKAEIKLNITETVCYTQNLVKSTYLLAPAEHHQEMCK